jgi:spermidine synthase
MVIPFSGLGAFFDIQALTVERYAKKNRANLLSSVELTRWDPVSKIDIIDLSEIKMKGISYDGGSQHSAFISFDGNFKRLRDNLSLLQDHIINPAVLAANYLKRDSNQQVMVIGSAGGKEIKVALMYGAGHVDAVELVGTVVELGKNKYADYIGNLFNHPKVNVMVGEGRNVLRSMEQKYDIIQIFSNHTTSSIASGTGAMATGYLFTVEAFQEYFEKLNENGILQVNQLLYPRLVTAGAAAWKQLGRQDFQKHVVVIELGEVDWMPTVLVKNTPWTEQQVNELKDFLFGFPNWLGKEFRFTEDPIYPEKSFLSPVFYSGAIPESLADRVDYRIKPATDDSPYFIFLRNKLGLVEPKDDKFMNQAISELLNRPLYPWFITVDIFHFLVGGVASLFWAVAFIVLPLRFSTVGKAHWPGKVNALLYFACLGSGFIIFELALIHLFMHFIGNPLYAYSVTIFSMLLGAGLGSLCSSSLGISLQERWEWPFWGIFVTGVAILVGHSPIFDLLLGQPTWLRVLVSASMIVPFGFFLGIPFPLGILALEGYERMAIPWAWGINGLFTVIGGLTCILLSLLYGFTVAFVFAMSIYIIGLWQFWKLRGVAIHGEALG